MHLIKVGFMSMLFGTSALLTPKPVRLGPGSVTLRAPRPMTPASDSMQVLVSFGVPSESVRTRVTYGRFGPASVGYLRVRICEANGHCLPMTYGGAFVAANDYGLAFDLTSPAIRKAHFASVQLLTRTRIAHATVRLQNYLKLSPRP
jgi:hypothetical protein